MTIGTELYHRLSARGFSTLQARISGLQGEISSGKNDPRASADPLRAARLSAAQEQQTRIEGFIANTESAASRLGQGDAAMVAVIDVMQRLQELALAAASDTTSPADRAPMRTEVLQLRQTLIDIGNRRDGEGRPIFAGFANPETTFAETSDGIVYHGNSGEPSLRVSESLTLQTALPGDAVFLSLPGSEGARSAFDLAEDIASTLATALESTEVRASGTMPQALALTPSRRLEDWSFTLTGPMGSATITLTGHSGAPQDLADAINAASALTGVAASPRDDGTVALTGERSVTVSDMRRAGQPLRAELARLSGIDADGALIVPAQQLRDQRLDNGMLAARVATAHDHIVGQRAKLGAMAAAAETQLDALDARKLALDQAVTGLETLDIAAAVTELQSLLLTQQAAQQTHARVAGRTLFDYLS